MLSLAISDISYRTSPDLKSDVAHSTKWERTAGPGQGASVTGPEVNLSKPKSCLLMTGENQETASFTLIPEHEGNHRT